MKQVEFWQWWVDSTARPGKRSKTRWKMPECDALTHCATAERVPGTMELRELPETAAEMAWANASASIATPIASMKALARQLQEERDAAEGRREQPGDTQIK